jgi:hypothetical protein
VKIKILAGFELFAFVFIKIFLKASIEKYQKISIENAS